MWCINLTLALLVAVLVALAKQSLPLLTFLKDSDYPGAAHLIVHISNVALQYD